MLKKADRKYFKIDKKNEMLWEHLRKLLKIYNRKKYNNKNY